MSAVARQQVARRRSQRSPKRRPLTVVPPSLSTRAKLAISQMSAALDRGDSEAFLWHWSQLNDRRRAPRG